MKGAVVSNKENLYVVYSKTRSESLFVSLEVRKSLRNETPDMGTKECINSREETESA